MYCAGAATTASGGAVPRAASDASGGDAAASAESGCSRRPAVSRSLASLPSRRGAPRPSPLPPSLAPRALLAKRASSLL